KSWNSGECLRRVGGLLQALERAGCLDQSLEIGPAHRGACCIKSLAFSCSLALPLPAIRPPGPRGAVRIVQEQAGDQVLNIRLASGNANFERAQWRLKRQRLERVAVV